MVLLAGDEQFLAPLNMYFFLATESIKANTVNTTEKRA